MRALWRWFKAQGCPDGGRVFVTGEGEARLAPQVMAAAATGEDPACFGLHSLRAGGAADLEAEGSAVLARWREHGADLARVFVSVAGCCTVP